MARKRRKPGSVSLLGRVFDRLAAAGGAVALTLALFLVLPVMQSISEPPTLDMSVSSVSTAEPPPPPPPPEEEPEEEPEPEEKPPELAEQTPLLGLDQLELALNPGFGDGLGGDLAVQLGAAGASGDGNEAIFSMADLDQRPRVLYQPGPTYDAKLRKRAPGKVYVLFIVDEQGRTRNLKVQKSSDPVFEAPALKAVRQWKFEPGKRGGRPVRFRMRVPITFPKGA